MDELYGLFIESIADGGEDGLVFGDGLGQSAGDLRHDLEDDAVHTGSMFGQASGDGRIAERLAQQEVEGGVEVDESGDVSLLSG